MAMTRSTSAKTRQAKMLFSEAYRAECENTSIQINTALLQKDDNALEINIDSIKEHDIKILTKVLSIATKLTYLSVKSNHASTNATKLNKHGVNKLELSNSIIRSIFLITKLNNIVSIELDGLPFAASSLTLLEKSLNATPFLTKLVISNIPLGDTGVKILLKPMKGLRLKNLTLSHCQITDRGVNDLTNHLNVNMF